MLSKYWRLSIWLILVICISIWVAKSVQVQSDLSLFLPTKQTFVHKVLLSQLSNGGAARTLFATISGGTVEQRVSASQTLVSILRTSRDFEQVLNGEQGLSDKDIALLLQYRYLLSEHSQQGFLSSGNLQQALQLRLDELILPIPPLDKKYLPQDPTAELRQVLTHFNKKNQIHKYKGVWVSEDEQQAIIISRTHKGAVDLDEQQLILDFVEQSFSQVNKDKQLSLQLTGISVASTESKSIIQKEARIFSLMATMALLIVLYVAFGSIKLVLISALPMFSAILMGLFVVLIWFQSIHGITLVFAMTVLGMAIDYPIHLFSHLRAGQHATDSIKKIWTTILAGLVTTVIAFSTLIFSNFDGLYQLGLFTSTGLLAAALTTRYVLPDLIGEAKIKQRINMSIMDLSKTLVTSILVMSIVFIVAVFAWQLPSWEQSLASLSPLPKSYNQRDHQLRANLGVGDLQYVVLVGGQSVESALLKSELLKPQLDALVKGGILQSYEMAAQYLPSQSLQKQRALVLPNSVRLEASLNDALKNLRFKKGLFTPFLNDVARSKKLDGLTLTGLKGFVFEPIIESLLLKIDDDDYYALIHLNGVSDLHEIEHGIEFDAASRSIGTGIYDLKAVSAELLNNFYSEFLAQVAIAVIFIVAILIVTLKNIQRALLVMLILLFALSVEMAYLVLIGHQLTLFHLVSLILVFGLGLDYALFFTRDESEKDRESTLYGLFICLFSSLLVFGVLALSSIPVLHIIGLTTSVGVFLAFVFSTLISTFLIKKNL